MDKLIVAAFRAVRSLGAPGMLGVFVLSVIVTVAALLGFIALCSAVGTWLGEYLQIESLSWVGGVGSAVIAWFLFPGIMPVVISFFDERIAGLIERHDYAASKPRTPDFWAELLHDAMFSLKVVLFNIIALPFYIIPGINVVLFYGLNGWLLGKEFFLMAARRHVPIAEAEQLRRENGRKVMAAGVLLTLLATVPIVNLLAPFWGVAVMVHLFHRLKNTPSAQILPPNTP